jgi:hypothetical protein
MHAHAYIPSTCARARAQIQRSLCACKHYTWHPHMCRGVLGLACSGGFNWMKAMKVGMRLYQMHQQVSATHIHTHTHTKTYTTRAPAQRFAPNKRTGGATATWRHNHSWPRMLICCVIKRRSRVAVVVNICLPCLAALPSLLPAALAAH